MGYVAGFDEDVFISYAHNDDDVFAPEQWGWVTRLHHCPGYPAGDGRDGGANHDQF